MEIRALPRTARVAILLLVCLAAATGCSGSRNPEVGLGEPAELSDRTLTVNDALRNYTPPGQSPSKAGSGNEFVVVNLSVDNTSDEAIDIDPGDFQLQDSNGRQTNPSSITNVPNLISEARSLESGQKTTGYIGFEVPRGDPNLKLGYKPAGSPQDSATVDLQAS